MSDSTRLQDLFLQKLQTEQTAVAVFLVNGIKLHGMIDGFNDDVIFLKSAVTQMIYKHAVSTVVPTHQVDL